MSEGGCRLGAGGFGVVFRGLMGNTHVAVKKLNPVSRTQRTARADVNHVLMNDYKTVLWNSCSPSSFKPPDGFLFLKTKAQEAWIKTLVYVLFKLHFIQV